MFNVERFTIFELSFQKMLILQCAPLILVKLIRTTHLLLLESYIHLEEIDTGRIVPEIRFIVAVIGLILYTGNIVNIYW